MSKSASPTHLRQRPFAMTHELPASSSASFRVSSSTPRDRPPGTDRRVERTLRGLVRSFNRLVLGLPYHRFGVGEVARQAGVGRSTFYEHFTGKDDVLRKAVRPVLAPLAAAAGQGGNLSAIEAIVRHVAEQRTATLGLLNGDGRRTIEDALTDEIMAALVAEFGPAGSPDPTLPCQLRAVQIARMQLGLLQAWLEPQSRPCSADVIARTLLQSTVALRQATAS